MNEGKTDIRSDTSVSKYGKVKKTILIFYVLFSILTVIKMSAFLHGTEDDEIDDLRNQPWQQKNEGRLRDDETDGRRNQRLVFMDNVTHFLSHIPKSGGTYASSMLQKLLQAAVRLPNNRTERDVMMAQAIFNRSMHDSNFFAEPEFNQSMFDEGLYWRPEWRSRRMPPVDLTGETDAYTPPFVCDHGFGTAVSRFQPYFVRQQRIRFKCEMWVAEGPWNDIAHNVYTVLREPLSHVLSQYFHCTEVRIRQEMPAMDVWLETYANLKEEFPNKGKVYYDRLAALQKRFRCYNPIDSESVYTAFRYEHLPEEYTYPYPNTENRDEETKKLDKSLFEDLKRRFQIIGDTSQMTKTICAIFIDFTQGKHIPDICDCTHAKGDGDEDHGSRTFFISNLYTDPHTLSFQNNRLKIGYTPEQNSHGVKHHGSAYLKEMAPDQRELLTTLRSNDLLLYNISRAVFAEQIRDMEARYGIRVCDRWNQPKT
mmetsp:Transcript_45458/g.88798  ORF Transcript_45458/g.88798 Transcript_45458/m.88798 type:complete len:482 (+) Transcript_45458:163-1608(+)